MASLNPEAVAEAVETLMPRIARRLYGVRPDDPIAELPAVQLKICGHLQEGPSSITQVAEELGTTVSAATQLSDRLERAGLIRRRGAPYDRRVRLIELTEHGATLMRDRRALRRQQVLKVVKNLSVDESASLVACLNRLLEATWQVDGEVAELPGEDLAEPV